ncbi:MAG: hypothetical protein AAF696_17730 [Bacteroidota bacterium]
MSDKHDTGITLLGMMMSKRKIAYTLIIAIFFMAGMGVKSKVVDKILPVGVGAFLKDFLNEKKEETKPTSFEINVENLIVTKDVFKDALNEVLSRFIHSESDKDYLAPEEVGKSKESNYAQPVTYNREYKAPVRARKKVLSPKKSHPVEEASAVIENSHKPAENSGQAPPTESSPSTEKAETSLNISLHFHLTPPKEEESEKKVCSPEGETALRMGRDMAIEGDKLRESGREKKARKTYEKAKKEFEIAHYNNCECIDELISINQLLVSN